ncbi:MAG: hypothetical protein WD739_07170 [Actinomycetota bacterium]
MLRIATFALAGAFAVLGPTGAVLASVGQEGRTADTQAVLSRDEDTDAELATLERDDDDSRDSNDGNSNSFTSGVNSNDGTNSRKTGVTRSNRDRSGGDLTKDRTKDGPGGPTRDRSKGHTNDRSRHDTRRG